MRVIALVNPDSRSVPDNGCEKLAALLDELGCDSMLIETRGADIEQNMREAVASAPDTLVIWGGDGSVACALTESGPDGPPIVALPGGTMNMLQRQLHRGLMDWEVITRQCLTNCSPEPLPCGEIEGHRFYVAAMFGKLTGLNESREELRSGNLLGAARALLESDTLDLETRIRVRTLHGQTHTDIQAVAAAIALTDREPIRLEAAAIDPESILDFLAIGLETARVGWRESSQVETDMGRTIEVEDLRGANIPCVLDGEPRDMPSRASARLIKDAARVLRASPPE